MQLWVLNVSRPQACNFPRVIPEIDIWRAANLMLKCYGEKALQESTMRGRARPGGDHDGTATWRRIANAIGQLATRDLGSALSRRKGTPEPSNFRR